MSFSDADTSSSHQGNEIEWKASFLFTTAYSYRCINSIDLIYYIIHWTLNSNSISSIIQTIYNELILYRLNILWKSESEIEIRKSFDAGQLVYFHTQVHNFLLLLFKPKILFFNIRKNGFYSSWVFPSTFLHCSAVFGIFFKDIIIVTKIGICWKWLLDKLRFSVGIGRGIASFWVQRNISQR